VRRPRCSYLLVLHILRLYYLWSTMFTNKLSKSLSNWDPKNELISAWYLLIDHWRGRVINYWSLLAVADPANEWIVECYMCGRRERQPNTWGHTYIMLISCSILESNLGCHVGGQFLIWGGHGHPRPPPSNRPWHSHSSKGNTWFRLVA